MPFRNEQFEKIAQLKAEYLNSQNPILSMDTKKKKHWGNFYRDGRLYTTEVIETFDHDFPSAVSGRIIPHGLFDFKRNLGHITLGFSHDTSQFACDSLALWWRRYGQAAYPKAKSILLLCDGGRQQQRTALHFQRGFAAAGQQDRDSDSRGALPALLLEIQAD